MRGGRSISPLVVVLDPIPLGTGCQRKKRFRKPNRPAATERRAPALIEPGVPLHVFLLVYRICRWKKRANCMFTSEPARNWLGCRIEARGGYRLNCSFGASV